MWVYSSLNKYFVVCDFQTHKTGNAPTLTSYKSIFRRRIKRKRNTRSSITKICYIPKIHMYRKSVIFPVIKRLYKRLTIFTNRSKRLDIETISATFPTKILPSPLFYSELAILRVQSAGGVFNGSIEKRWLQTRRMEIFINRFSFSKIDFRRILIF